MDVCVLHALPTPSDYDDDDDERQRQCIIYVLLWDVHIFASIVSRATHISATRFGRRVQRVPCVTRVVSETKRRWRRHLHLHADHLIYDRARRSRRRRQLKVVNPPSPHLLCHVCARRDRNAYDIIGDDAIPYAMPSSHSYVHLERAEQHVRLQLTFAACTMH